MPTHSPSHGEFGTNGLRGASGKANSGAQVKLEFDKPNNPQQASPNRLYLPHNPNAERTDKAPATPNSKQPHVDASLCTGQHLPNGQHKKKKSKKHKEKERERLKPDWIETSPDLKKSQEHLKGNQVDSHHYDPACVAVKAAPAETKTLSIETRIEIETKLRIHRTTKQNKLATVIFKFSELGIRGRVTNKEYRSWWLICYCVNVMLVLHISPLRDQSSSSS